MNEKGFPKKVKNNNNHKISNQVHLTFILYKISTKNKNSWIYLLGSLGIAPFS